MQFYREGSIRFWTGKEAYLHPTWPARDYKALLVLLTGNYEGLFLS